MRDKVLVGVLIFSLLPIWKSGIRRGMNLWEFTIGHTVFSPWPSLYVPEEYATRAVMRELWLK